MVSETSIIDESSKLTGIFSFLIAIGYLGISIAFLFYPEDQSGGATYLNADNFYPSLDASSTAWMTNHFLWVLTSLFALGVVLGLLDQLQQTGSYPIARYASVIGAIAWATVFVSTLTALSYGPKLASIYSGLEPGEKSIVGIYGPFGVDPDTFTWFGFTGLWLIIINFTSMKEEKISKNLGLLGIIVGIGSMMVVFGFLFNIPLLTQILAGLIGVIGAPAYYIWLGRTLRRD